MEYLVGVDLGGTNIVCGLLDLDGQVLRITKQPTEPEKGSDAVIHKIAEMIRSLLQDQSLTSASVLSVGMGTPGLVDPERGISLGASNLGWKNIPVAKLLQERICLPVFIDNDVRTYVYGEAMKGAGCGYGHVLGVTIGTGIASALVKDGQMYYGGAFLAGEMGHIPMEGLSHPCNCGGIGCLETAVSAPGIARQAVQAIQGGKRSVLQQWFADLSRITALDVSKAYDAGDAVAIDVMNRTGAILARALSFAVPLLSPDLIIIGGGTAMAGDRLLNPIKEQLRRLVRPIYWNRVEIRTAQWIEEAGIIGSALFAKQKMTASAARHTYRDKPSSGTDTVSFHDQKS